MLCCASSAGHEGAWWRAAVPSRQGQHCLDDCDSAFSSRRLTTRSLQRRAVGPHSKGPALEQRCRRGCRRSGARAQTGGSSGPPPPPSSWALGAASYWLTPCHGLLPAGLGHLRAHPVAQALLPDRPGAGMRLWCVLLLRWQLLCRLPPWDRNSSPAAVLNAPGWLGMRRGGPGVVEQVVPPDIPVRQLQGVPAAGGAGAAGHAQRPRRRAAVQPLARLVRCV